MFVPRMFETERTKRIGDETVPSDALGSGPRTVNSVVYIR